MRHARWYLVCLFWAACTTSSATGDAGVDLAGGAEDAAANADSGDGEDLTAVGNDGAPPPIDLAAADLSPRMVTGTVVDYYDAPVPGWTVTLVGGGSTTTDAMGHFTLVTPGGFYDVFASGVQTASQDSPGRSVVAHYVGLTRSDPTLRLSSKVLKTPAPNRSTTITGGCSGMALPLGATVNGNVGADIDRSHTTYFNSGDNSLTFTSLPIAWSGGTTQNTTVRALFSTLGGDGLATIAYGQVGASLTDGADTAVGTIAVTVPPTQNLTCNLTPVAGANSIVNVAVSAGSASQLTALLSNVAAGALTLPQPVIAGSTIRFAATSAFNTPPARYGKVIYEGLPANAALLAVAVPAPGTAVVPSGSPSAVPRTADFTVQNTGSAGQVHSYYFSTPNGTWTVVSAANTAKFPDATALGIANPATTDSVLSGVVEYPYPSVDASAGGSNFNVTATAVPAGQPFRFWAATFTSFFFTN